MTKAVFFDIDDTIYDYIGAHNNTMPVMKEWAYKNLGIAQDELEKYVAEARVKADDRAGRDYAVNHNRLVRFQCMLETLGKPVFPYAYERSCTKQCCKYIMIFRLIRHIVQFSLQHTHNLIKKYHSDICQI